MISMAILPLVVVISQSPPSAERGTFTLLVLSVMKILSERIVPFTEPLVVSIRIQKLHFLVTAIGVHLFSPYQSNPQISSESVK